jgi:superfamily I DNA/RNA helicase
MAARYLINSDGQPFEKAELVELAHLLDSLNPGDRTSFRNKNAEAIATHAAERILIVSGPGTGKSTLFKQRILYWLEEDPSARILAVSFVRKLVADLHNDIQTADTLTDEQKRQVDVFTLHKYARSIVEQNHGTREWPFAPHFRIIGQTWKDVVWNDVLLLVGVAKDPRYTWRAFEKQLHDGRLETADDWAELADAYFTLCGFYNAAGFGDLILRARDALAEAPDLNTHQFFIFDEYQDFNEAEEQLLLQITDQSSGSLLVGDDDQVLYETLKSGKASLIRAIYEDESVVNAMLPFCGRCDFHIARTADYFIKQTPDPDAIAKVYLPISTADEAEKVHVVGCPTPSGAVDYIRKFIEDHSDEIEQRRKDLLDGNAKDAFLLILSPAGPVNFYKTKGAQQELFDLVKSYRDEQRGYSEDYYKVLTYYSLARYPANNFTFRKVLHYERISNEDLLSLLATCIDENKPFVDLDADSVRRALDRAAKVRDILETEQPLESKVEELCRSVELGDPDQLLADLQKQKIDDEHVESVELQEEEQAELEEIEVKRMAAVELMTIVGSKGLSADHVIIIGFDNVKWCRTTP